MIRSWVRRGGKVAAEKQFDCCYVIVSEGEAAGRRWTFQNVLEKLKSLRRERVRLAGVEFEQNTFPDTGQQRIINPLGIKM